MKKSTFESLMISLMTGAVTAALSVACAPTHPSYPLDKPAVPATSLSAPSTNNTPSSQLNGDWVCKTGDSCTYSMISLSGANAILSGETQTTAQLSVTAVSGQLHLDLNTGGLEGDLEVIGGQNELVFNDEHYVRKT